MPAQCAIQNRIVRYLKTKEGLTLVEVIVALTIFLIVFLGIMQVALLSIDHNMHNILRDEAVTIAGATMEEVRSKPFASVFSDTTSGDISAAISAGDCPNTFTTGNVVHAKIRNMTKPFCVNLTCTDLDGDGDCTTDDSASNTKQVSVRVAWKWKGEDYLQTVTTLRRR